MVGISYENFWWKLSLHEISLIIEAYEQKQKDYFTLMAYSVANGVSSILNGTPIQMFGDDNKESNNSNNKTNYIDKETKEQELKELEREFS